MQELIENIQSIKGLIEFNIEPGYWQDEDGDEVQVNLIILHHLFDSFKDENYLELMSLFPENTDEYEDEEGYYVSTFIDYEV
jgi:hypothetical protein